MVRIIDTIVAKSDQLNNIDLIGRELVIEITKVTVKMAEQPVTINYVGDNGKPWKPNLSMRRVIIAGWGEVEENYVGRKIRLYRDPEVSMGGLKTGGTRIMQMSHIKAPFVVVLPVSRGRHAPYKVMPLVEVAPESPKPPAAEINVAQVQAEGRDEAAQGMGALKAWWTGIGGATQKAIGGAEFLAELKLIAEPPMNDEEISI